MKIFIFFLALIASAEAAQFDTVVVENALTPQYCSINTVPYINGQNNLVSSVITPTELGYLDGVSSNIQAQINALQPSGNYITGLHGAVSASGPGNAAATLSSTGVSAGSYTNTSLTVGVDGRITAATSGAGSGVYAVTASSPLFSSGGSTPNITCQSASGSQAGCLSSTDWSSFDSKQAAGNYITALTGDITASGPGSSTATLATVNSGIGTFTNPIVTVNAKGLITAVSSGSSGANTALSNLTSPTAVNQDIYPNSDNNLFLGSDTLAWAGVKTHALYAGNVFAAHGFSDVFFQTPVSINSFPLSGATYIQQVQIATPSVPTGLSDRLYFKSDDKLYRETSSGVEDLIGPGILPTPLEAVSSLTQSFWASPGTFIGNNSDSDQTNLNFQTGSTDTATGNNSTSNVTFQSGSITAIGSSGGTGETNIVAGSITDPTSTGSINGVYVFCGQNNGSGSGGTCQFAAGNSTIGPAGNISSQAGISTTGTPGSFVLTPGRTTPSGSSATGGDFTIASNGAGTGAFNVALPVVITPSSTQIGSSGLTIPYYGNSGNSSFIPIIMAGSSVVTSSVTPIQAPLKDGQILQLLNEDSTYTLTIKQAGDVDLPGHVDYVLAPRGTISFISRSNIWITTSAVVN